MATTRAVEALVNHRAILKGAILLGLGWFTFGLFTVPLSAIATAHDAWVLRDAPRARGVVVAVHRHVQRGIRNGSSYTHTTTRVTYRFTPASGPEVTAERVVHGAATALTEGAPIEVAFHREAPARLSNIAGNDLLYNKGELIGSSVLTGGLGLMIVGLAVLGWLGERRDAKARDMRYATESPPIPETTPPPP